jgi:ABC-type multidrug transport system ATPase subunit
MKVTVAGLKKRFGRQRVLKSVDLDPPKGSIVAIVGVNGAGKSTILHCLAGLLSIDDGNVYFDSEEFRPANLEMRRRLLFLTDFPFFVLAKTLLEHLSLVLRLYQRNANSLTDKTMDLLREFDLLPFATRPLGELSRGQLYKGALVALILADPDLWLLDEPLASGMDPLGLKAFQKHARQAAARGRTILYSTQILDAAERFSDHVAILHDGVIQAFAKTSEIRAGNTDGALADLFSKLAEPVA